MLILCLSCGSTLYLPSEERPSCSDTVFGFGLELATGYSKTSGAQGSYQQKYYRYYAQSAAYKLRAVGRLYTVLYVRTKNNTMTELIVVFHVAAVLWLEWWYWICCHSISIPVVAVFTMVLYLYQLLVY